MSKECLKESGMSKVLKALDIANKRIDELEKYNLDLANESHNKSLAIERANERVNELENQLQITTLTTHEASFESEYGKKRLNKFAIEKKVEALNKLSAPLNYNIEHPEFCMKKRIEVEIEQLRKEQDSEQ